MPESDIRGVIPLFRSTGGRFEFWDKAVPGKLDRTGLTVHCPSGPASLDWRYRGERQREGTADEVVDMIAPTRVEIQQDETMAMITPGSTVGSMGTMVLGAVVLPVDTSPVFLAFEYRRRALLMGGLDPCRRRLKCLRAVLQQGGGTLEL
ncbi:hypothetical protein NDU88_006931 [Pleurodeles waltl]|uniref:Uncharacterized protein n=1 Tax=Pleurodeles waltl TaxID=8319 RepID=A0AAV7RQW1_PLEWA|nr:hypothetical protein NDU88_006931 [Pleurodeles waltl]